MYKLLLTAALGAILCAGVGCDDRDVEFHAHYDRESGHVCTRECHDHYYDGGKVIVIKGRHRHGPDCGHSWAGSRWTLSVNVGGRNSRDHICTRSCDHYYDGGKLIVIKKGHRHDDRCGHQWDGKRWILAKLAKAVVGRDRGHVCTRSCDHYYDGGKLIVIKKGHRHGRDCGHDWDGKRWVLAKLAKAVIGRDRGHRCTRACNEHYYDRGGKLVVIKNHRHGDKCGHRWEGDRWVLTIKGKLKGRP